MMKIKKILLTIIYPFWIFFAKLWLGGVFVLCSTFIIPALILGLIFPDWASSTGDSAQGMAFGMGLVCLLCAPFVFMFLEIIGDYLEQQYQKFGYQTQYGDE